MIAFLLWCFLFILCWPLALLALILYPFVWLLLLPFRLVGIAVHGALALVWAVVMLPARLLSAPFKLSQALVSIVLQDGHSSPSPHKRVRSCEFDLRKENLL